jgi:asparagine synthase (glutamine-hydrolysing)
MRYLPEATYAVGETQQAFSAIFPNSVNDEERYIDAVAARYPQTLAVNKTTPRPTEFLDDLADFIATQEEPLISTGPYAQYSVMKAASGRLGVLLDGEGADEMLAGYVPYYLVYFRQLKRQGRWIKLAKEVVMASDKLLRLARFRLLAKMSRRRRFDERAFLADDFAARFADERLAPVTDNLKLRLLKDLFRDSTPCSIRYVDRNTARFGLEGRQPFLDANLVRFIFSLPDEAIIKDSWNKRLLMEAVRDILPREVWARRNKVGFSTPEDEWFELLKDTLRELFESESFAARPYFDRDAVLEAFNAFADGTGEASTMTFWRLLNVELWLRTFIDTP